MSMCELRNGKYLGYDYSHIKLKDAIKAFEKVSCVSFVADWPTINQNRELSKGGSLLLAPLRSASFGSAAPVLERLRR